MISTHDAPVVVARHFDDHRGHHSPGERGRVSFVGVDAYGRMMMHVAWDGGGRSVCLPDDLEEETTCGG